MEEEQEEIYKKLLTIMFEYIFEKEDGENAEKGITI